jgi:hypothetical protein
MLALSAPVQRLAVFVYRLRWLNFPATVLLALLQRTPVLRLAAGAGEALALSPLGAVLRSTAATAAALGAVHALAGATQLTASNPSPLNLTAGVAIGQVAMTVTGAQSAPGSFRVTGAIPPGLSLSGLTGAGGTVNVSTMFLSGTPTTAGSYVMSIRAYERANLGGDVSSIFTYTVNVAAGTPANTAPVFTTQPQGATVSAGGSVTFSALAAGTPAPGYQWRLNAIALAGATNPTLTLTNVKAADAGDYTVLATNSAGSAVSATATLAVSAPATAPVFTAQPVSQTIASGSTVVFSAAASGATSWQWQRDGVALAGATSAALVLAGEQARPGAYRVAASNSSGSTMSEAATLTAVASSNFGRLINLSILTAITAPGGSFTMGYVVGGAGTSGAKQLVIRAAGPSLGALGVAGTMADPKIELFAGATPTGSNDDWGGGISLAAALASVGAFPYVSGTSHDAAAVALITSRGGLRCHALGRVHGGDAAADQRVRQQADRCRRGAHRGLRDRRRYGAHGAGARDRTRARGIWRGRHDRRSAVDTLQRGLGRDRGKRQLGRRRPAHGGGRGRRGVWDRRHREQGCDAVDHARAGQLHRAGERRDRRRHGARGNLRGAVRRQGRGGVNPRSGLAM